MKRDIFINIQSRSAALGLLITVLAPAACTAPPAPITSAPETTSKVIVPTTAYVISAEADNALKVAEQNVAEARLQKALWIAAVEELEKARTAAKAFDSEGTLKHAREVILLCALSLQQKQAPPVTW